MEGTAHGQIEGIIICLESLKKTKKNLSQGSQSEC
jgi:hypothetical protein